MAQGVVVDSVHRFARCRADVALLGSRVFLVNAALNFGQDFHQLASLFFALQLFGLGSGQVGVGWGQGGQLALDLCQQQRLLFLQVLQLACSLFLGRIPKVGQCRGRQGAGGTALVRIPTAGQRVLGNDLRLVRLLVGLGVDQDHFQGRIFKHPFEGLWVYKPHRQQRCMHRNGYKQGNLEGANRP